MINIDRVVIEPKSNEVMHMGAPPLYWCLPYSGASYEADTHLKIPEDTVTVKDGAKIITCDDIFVGNVEQVLPRYEAGRVTYFLVARGLLQKEKKLIPVSWIDRLGEDELFLMVGSSTVEKLPVIEHA